MLTRIAIIFLSAFLICSESIGQGSIEVTFSSCPSGEFTYVFEDIDENGRPYYLVSPPTGFNSEIYWDNNIGEWHILIQTEDGNGLTFSSSLNTLQPPCLEDGNWAMIESNIDCTGNETILNIVSSDGRCSSIPTLSQWGLIILGLCLSVIGFVAVRQRIFSAY